MEPNTNTPPPPPVNTNTPPPPPPPPPPVTQVPPPTYPPVETTEYKEKGFFKSMDWVQFGILATGLFAIFCAIGYYRQKAKKDKENTETLKQVNNEVVELKSQFNGIKHRIGRRA